jgi:hypothetical protein
MNFTGRKPLNLPYYLFRSLGKMSDRVQVRKDQGEPSLFHFSLIKLFVSEELRKRNQDWEYFLSSLHIEIDSFSSPPSMRDTLSSIENTTTYIPESSIKKRKKETE